MLRRPLSFLAALVVLAACRPAVESKPGPAVTENATSDLPALLDPAPARDVVLGKLFAPDGSIQPPDRTSEFAHGAPIFLSVDVGDLPRGTPVIATWTAPDGAVTDQKTMVVGGEPYLTFTAPSAGWTPGAGLVTVRAGESEPRELPFTIAP